MGTRLALTLACPPASHFPEAEQCILTRAVRGEGGEWLGEHCVLSQVNPQMPVAWNYLVPMRSVR